MIVFRITKNIKPCNYNKLDESGFVPKNTYVCGDDIVIGKGGLEFGTTAKLIDPLG